MAQSALWCINVSYATTKLICISLALWTVCWSVIQLGIFSWQISDWRTRTTPVDATDHQIKQFNNLWTALNVLHIINLLLSIMLIIAGLGLAYFVWIDSKSADVPWAIVFGSSIIGIIVWCVVWWAIGVHDYWLMLTIVEFLFSLFNSLCLIYAITLHRRFMTV